MSGLKKGWGIDSSKQSARDEADLKETARRQRIERAKDEPQFFCEYYLGHFFRHPRTGEFTGLADWQEETRGLSQITLRLAVAAPRGHGKTTFLSFGLTLRDLLIGASIFTLYIGPTFTAASDRVEEIRMELENNERIREDFGDLLTGEGVEGSPKQPRGQRRDSLALANGARIMARGCGQSLRGVKHGEARPDRIILDDVDKDDEAASAERIEKRIRWFKRVVLGLKGAGDMRVLVVGNIISRFTLLTHCLAAKGFVSRIYRALLDNGEPLMPKLWTRELLEATREEIGTDAFETEYQNNPPSEGARVFQEAWLRRRWSREMLEAIQTKRIVVALDLSKGKSERSDFQALVAVLRDNKGNVLILKADINRRTRRELGTRIFTFCQAVGLAQIVSVVIEANAFQEWFAEEIKEQSAENGTDLPIVEQTHTTAKFDRIAKVSPIAEGGRLYWPPEDEEDEGIALLRRQMEGFPDALHDDGPDALAMAIEETGRLVRGSKALVIPYTPHDREQWDYSWKDQIAKESNR